MRFLLMSLFAALTSVSTGQVLDDAELVKQADRQLNDLILKNNAVSADPFYAAEFILTTSSGKQKSKLDVLSEISSPDLRLEINATEEVQVRLSGSTAVLTGILHQKGSYKQKSFDAFLRVTDTWVKTPSGWKILAGHASIIPKN